MIHEEIDLFQLSDNMANSKNDLLAYIGYFHDEKSMEYDDAKFLMSTKKDLDMWMELWSANPDEVYETNRLLREWKIDQMMDGCSFEDFNDLLFDEVDFVETFFQQQGNKRTLWELNRVLEEKSVGELWEIHREYPYARIEYF